MAITLESIETGRDFGPIRAIIYGPPGIGKSTFAAESPSPIFIQTEDGIGNLDVARFPRATSYDQVIECLTTLYREDHSYKTVVLDSLDWTEQLAHSVVRQQHGDGIFSDFGKGYLYAVPLMERIQKALVALRESKKMNVIITSHSQIVKFNSPEVEPYERYIMDVHKEVEKLYREWCDCCLFTNEKVYTTSTDVGFNKKVVRGTGRGERVLYTENRPAYVAKNRYSLPAELPLSWKAFSDAIDKSRGGKGKVEAGVAA